MHFKMNKDIKQIAKSNKTEIYDTVITVDCKIASIIAKKMNTQAT